MKPRLVLAILLCLSLSALVIARPSPGMQAAPQVSYSNSTDGLQKLVWDMLSAEKSGGTQAVSPYLQSLSLPNPSDWFSSVFGSTYGQMLAVFYDAWTGPRNSQIAGDIARALALQMNDVAALSFEL